MMDQLPHDLQSYEIMRYGDNGLQSITVAVGCGSALGYGDSAARTSLWLAYAGLVMIRLTPYDYKSSNGGHRLRHVNMEL